MEVYTQVEAYEVIFGTLHDQQYGKECCWQRSIWQLEYLVFLFQRINLGLFLIGDCIGLDDSMAKGRGKSSVTSSGVFASTFCSSCSRHTSTWYFILAPIPWMSL